jgi:phosphoserine phosphatase
MSRGQLGVNSSKNNHREGIMNNTDSENKISELKEAAAVLDWDGTLRKGYEILDWTNFLDESGKFDSDTAVRQRELVSNYLARKIPYAQAVLDVGVIYAEGIAGHKIEDTLALAAQFARIDKAIFGFTPAFFKILLKNNLRIVLISNTPQVMLDVYRKHFGLTEVYGLQVEQRAGLWANQVIINPGLSDVKRRIVKELVNKYNIILGMGDTHEDAPLLEAAKIRLFLKPESKPNIRIPEVAELQVVDENSAVATAEAALAEICTR